MKEGSLIVFEQCTTGLEMCNKQKALFPEVVIIESGTSGLICRVYECNMDNMLLAEY